MTDIQLSRNPFGQLVFRDAAGTEHVGVVPVHAFPLSAPDTALSLVSADGHEIYWLETPSRLPAEIRALLDEELARREFMPEILCIHAVDSFAMPSTWQLDTDRGERTLTLKSEDDIRRLPEHGLIIADKHGLHFRIRDLHKLDRHSRKLLDRFL